MKIPLIALLALITPLSFAQRENAIGADLLHAQFCAKAAKEFKNTPEWNDAAILSKSINFTSHYNKSLDKCLVQVVSIEIADDHTVITLSHVYDSFEGTVLGGKVTTKPPKGTTKDERVVMVRNGKTLSDKNETIQAYIWYESLMKD
jgi:hypothetical protein